MLCLLPSDSLWSSRRSHAERDLQASRPEASVLGLRNGALALAIQASILLQGLPGGGPFRLCASPRPRSSLLPGLREDAQDVLLHQVGLFRRVDAIDRGVVRAAAGLGPPFVRRPRVDADTVLVDPLNPDLIPE